jgi:hypothetical protein
MGWVVSATPRPLYSWERPGTHFIEGWVGPRVGLDRCGKSHPLPKFDCRNLQAVASRYTDLTISAHNGINVWGRKEVPVFRSPWQCRAFPMTYLSSCIRRYFQIHVTIINFDLNIVLSSTCITCTNESFDDLSVEISAGDTVDLRVHN